MGPLAGTLASLSMGAVYMGALTYIGNAPNFMVYAIALHDPIAKTGEWVKQMLQGHLNYYAVSGNHTSMWWFCNQVRWVWLKTLKRRSQKAYLSWERFLRLVDRFFPPIKVLHPLPLHRFDAKTRGRSPVR